MAEDFPYTDEQVEQLRRALMGWCSGWPGPETVLRTLHAHGYEVKFPEPRYYVRRQHPSGTSTWWVRERGRIGFIAAFSTRHPQAEQYAREFADRLNREAN